MAKLTVETYNFLMQVLESHKMAIHDEAEDDMDEQLKEVHIAEGELEAIGTY